VTCVGGSAVCMVSGTCVNQMSCNNNTIVCNGNCP
jgi:hypothetical protein